jgi:hypothetical protein
MCVPPPLMSHIVASRAGNSITAFSLIARSNKMIAAPIRMGIFTKRCRCVIIVGKQLCARRFAEKKDLGVLIFYAFYVMKMWFEINPPTKLACMSGYAASMPTIAR